MPDAAEPDEVITSREEADLAAEAAADADGDADPDVDAVDLIKTEPNNDANNDAMDVDTEVLGAESNIEVLRSRGATEKTAEAPASSDTPPASNHQDPVAGQETEPNAKLPNGIPPPDSGSPPPSVDGYQPAPLQPPSDPLTPPQSNGSLGRGPDKEPGDVLSEGGSAFYLSQPDLSVHGTTVSERIVRRAATPPPPMMTDEELSEMDEDTLADLGIDVNDHTINASPVASEPPTSARKARANPARFRKGVRSSARRR